MSNKQPPPEWLSRAVSQGWIEAEADARLIAAAPELLAALESLTFVVVNAVESGDWRVDGACDPDAAIKAAFAALIKAKP